MNIIVWTLPGNRASEQADFGLKFRNIPFENKTVGQNATMEEFLAQFPNTSEFPQVIIDNTHIGGYKELENFMINDWKPNE